MYKTARIASDMIGETRKLMADLTKCRDENRVIFQPLMRDTLALLKEQKAKIKSLERTIEDICCGG